MTRSMTGFGASSFEKDGFRVNVEIKTLNSKQLDLNIRIPRSISDKELEIRNLVSDALTRGKVSLMIDINVQNLNEGKAKVNQAVVKNYYEQLKATEAFCGLSDNDLFIKALELPQAIEINNDEDTTEEQWDATLNAIKQALAKCNEFRLQEGQALEKKLLEYISTIESYAIKVAELDPIRLEQIKTRVQEKMDSLIGSESFDQNRFEQEMVYYLEKLDITEEKVRLKAHLDYFREVIGKNDASGKKLGFIGQEIGREINTTGSKANNSDIQKLVVGMKEELEKIKEQVLNVL